MHGGNVNSIMVNNIVAVRDIFSFFSKIYFLEERSSSIIIIIKRFNFLIIK